MAGAGLCRGCEAGFQCIHLYPQGERSAAEGAAGQDGGRLRRRGAGQSVQPVRPSGSGERRQQLHQVPDGPDPRGPGGLAG